jgi:hypothetical protein
MSQESDGTFTKEKDMKIQYYQKGGRIGATYHLSHDELDEIDHSLAQYSPSAGSWYGDIDIGLVPEEIQEKGKDEIHRYVKRACDEHCAKRLAEQRKLRDEYYNRINNLNQEVAVQHADVTIVGRIVSHQEGAFIRLEQPFAYEKGYILRGFRMSPLFDHEGHIAEEHLARAKELLVYLYDEGINYRMHGEVARLVEALNGAKAVGDCIPSAPRKIVCLIEQ